MNQEQLQNTNLFFILPQKARRHQIMTYQWEQTLVSEFSRFWFWPGLSMLIFSPCVLTRDYDNVSLTYAEFIHVTPGLNVLLLNCIYTLLIFLLRVLVLQQESKLEFDTARSFTQSRPCLPSARTCLSLRSSLLTLFEHQQHLTASTQIGPEVCRVHHLR